MSNIEEIRTELTSLHFAQDAMRPHERRTLHIAEDLLRRIDAVLEMCDRADRMTASENWQSLHSGGVRGVLENAQFLRNN